MRTKLWQGAGLLAVLASKFSELGSREAWTIATMILTFRWVSMAAKSERKLEFTASGKGATKFPISDFRLPNLCDAEVVAEGEFAGVHLAGIGFVIITAEVEKAMENELFYLEFEREAGLGGLSGGLLGGDDDIA